MRIAEAAELTGTTVRTIRWYHRQDLVPVPDTHGAYRRYEAFHVARILRVRWLAQAGLSLSAVRDLLEDEAAALSETRGPAGTDGRASNARSSGRPVRPEHQTAADLRAVLAQIDGQLAQLEGQREQIRRLIDSMEAGGDLTPLPRDLTAAMGQLAEGIEDPALRRLVHRERRIAEMLAQRGLLRAEDLGALGNLLLEDLGELIPMAGRFEALCDLQEGDPGASAEAQAVGEELAGWYRSHREILRARTGWEIAWRQPLLRSLMLRIIHLEYPNRWQREAVRISVRSLDEVLTGGGAPEPDDPERTAR